MYNKLSNFYITNKKNVNNYLLYLMCCFYLFPIIYVCMYYDNSCSISSIICDEKIKYIILFFMILMGCSTILYEYRRNDIYSLIIISILLISIYILIYFPENNILHYIFASTSFISILLFMIRHYYRICNQYNYILQILVFIQILLIILMIRNCFLNLSIFLFESIYLLIFAIFYLYIHNK